MEFLYKYHSWGRKRCQPDREIVPEKGKEIGHSPNISSCHIRLTEALEWWTGPCLDPDG